MTVGHYQKQLNYQLRHLDELANRVYDININPDPRVLMQALFDIRDNLHQVILALKLEIQERGKV